MRKMISHGTGEQMLEAFEQKLNVLENSDKPVESATSIEASVEKPKRATHGTAEQMLAAFENKIDHLEGNVDAASKIGAANEIEEDIVEYLAPEDEERYIHTLIGDTNTELEDLDIFDSWTWEDSEDDLILTTVSDSEVQEYTIPKSDLKFDWDNIEEDVQYIVQATTDSEESDDIEDVESAEDVVGATINYDSTDDKSVVIPKSAKTKFYADSQGGFGGDENDVYSLEDIMIIWNSEHNNDPSMSVYDSFNEWWEDTRSFMKRVAPPAVNPDDEERFTDPEGVLGLDPEETVSKGEMRKYFEENPAGDPSFAEYDSFEAWWAETEPMLQPVENSTTIEGAWQYDEDEEPSQYTEIASKSVPDSDGFYTDYTMYRNIETGEYVFVFGDKDVYTPDQEDFDWSCDTEEEAWEWYNDYTGFSDDQYDESYFVPDEESGVKTYNNYSDPAEANVNIPNKRSGYSPDLLQELVNEYSSYDTSSGNYMTLDEIWDDIVNRYGDEDLANDVLEAIDPDSFY